MKVSRVSVTQIKPKLSAPVAKKFAELVPTVTIPELAEIDIDGIRAAEINAIRRIILNELPVTILHCEYNDIETDDQHTIAEMIQLNLNRIPLLQTARPGLKYSVNVINDTADAKHVYARDMVGGPPLFNTQFIIATIGPFSRIRIDNITTMIVKGYKTSVDQIGHLTVQASIIPIRSDLKIYDMYETKDANVVDPVAADAARGIRSSVSGETQYRLRFKTLGTMSVKNICVAAINSMLERIQTARNIATTTLSQEDENHFFFLEDESDTLGVAFMLHALDVDPTSRLTTRVLSNARQLDVRFALGEYDSGTKFISAVCESMEKTYRALLAVMSAAF